MLKEMAENMFLQNIGVRLRLKCDGTRMRRKQISSFGETDESI